MRKTVVAALAVSSFALSGCGDDPVQVEFEVIEETTFGASLGVDLDSMTRTGTGVYWEDRGMGAGEAAIFGTNPFVSYTLWLADGTEVENGSFSFFMGNQQVIPGFEEGLLNAQEGGTRFMVIPPNRAYGGQEQRDQVGNVIIPGGAILVFEVTVDSVLVVEGG